MGLDIYVRWDNMTEAEHDAQITGFSDAPDVGYLRFNWWGVSFMNHFATENNFPSPIVETFQEWEGGNGEVYSVTRDKLDQLLAYQARLEGWLAEHPENKMVGENVDYYYRKIRNWITFIDFLHKKIDEPGLTVIYG